MVSVAGKIRNSRDVLSNGREVEEISTEDALTPTGGGTTTDGRLVLHVLVVDDDVELRKACAEVAVRMGCAVVQAETVSAAQEILQERKVDLRLLDLRLPGGLELLEQVKVLYP